MDELCCPLTDPIRQALLQDLDTITLTDLRTAAEAATGRRALIVPAIPPYTLPEEPNAPKTTESGPRA